MLDRRSRRPPGELAPSFCVTRLSSYLTDFGGTVWTAGYSSAMMSYLVNFDSIAWESPMPGVRHKVHCVETRILRLVEYSQDMIPHWCSKGHIGHIIQGRLDVEFKTGTEIFGAGDAVFIPPGSEHAHRTIPLTSVVTALFVEDA